MGLLGRKLGMTQIFAADGTVVPVTLVEAGPNTVLQVKTAAGNDGYNAIQLGFGTKKEHRANKPEMGRAKAANTQPAAFVAEIRVGEADAGKYTAGQTVGVAEVFEVG